MAYRLADGSLSTEYKVGDKFVVVTSGTIIKDSVVALFEDDNSSSPLFKVIEGSSNFYLCKGEAGAYKAWNTVKAYTGNLVKPTLFQRIKKVIKQWLSN